MTLVYNRGISPDGNTLYFTDGNTWGGENPARNSIAVIAFATLKNSKGDIVVSPLASNPLTVTSFSIDVTLKDGVYNFRTYSLPLGLASTSVSGDIFFDTGDNTAKKNVSGVVTPIVEADLSGITNKGSSWALVGTQLSIVTDQLMLIKLEKLQAYQNDQCEYNDLVKASNGYNLVRSLRVGASIDFCGGNYSNAQLKVEAATSFASNALAEWNNG